MKTYKFWTAFNGTFVKIKIEDGQRLYFSRHTKHEEGWTSEQHYIERKGREVYERIIYDGRDCDGRLTDSYLYKHKVGHLIYNDYLGRMVPKWRQVPGQSRRFDEFAVASGY